MSNIPELVQCEHCGGRGSVWDWPAPRPEPINDAPFSAEWRAMTREQYEALRAGQATLESIRAAVREYHEALDQRRSGVVAQGRAFDKIVTILDMPWRPGGES